METETLDKLYLEISQFTEAKTKSELYLENMIRNIANATTWEDQAALAEIALADIEKRPVAEFAMEWMKAN